MFLYDNEEISLNKSNADNSLLKIIDVTIKLLYCIDNQIFSNRILQPIFVKR